VALAGQQPVSRRADPGAQPLELPGVDDDPWVGATDDTLAAVEGFVAAIGRDRPERTVAA
jgi:hypothetical protein